MRYLTLFILCFALLIVGCDGKNIGSKTNKEIFESGQHSKSFLEIEEYIPESYAEVTIDSISSNGYKINATFSTDMEKSILLTEKIDSLTQRTHFRELITKVKVYKDDAIVFDDIIDKDYLISKGAFSEEDAKRFAINDFNMFFNSGGNPVLMLHYTHTKSNEMKVINFYFYEDKSFFEIIT